VIGNNGDMESENIRKLCVVSCPDGVERSAVSGPWSMEWLKDKICGDADIIFM